MNKGKKKWKTIVDTLYTIVVSIVFSVSIGNIIPHIDRDGELLRIIVIGWLCMMSYFFVAAYIDNYKEVYKERKHPYLAVAVTILLFPSMLSFDINNKADEYLRNYPEDHKATFVFDINIDKIRDSGIGDSIHSNTFVNDIRITGKTYQDGSEKRLNNTITVNVDEPMIIRTRITESDEAITDCGEKTYKLEYYAQNKSKLHYSISFSQTITVKEEGGRINSGATADFVVDYEVKRVIPDLSTWLLLPFSITSCKDICYFIAMVVTGIWSASSVRLLYKKASQIEQDRINQNRKEKGLDIGTPDNRLTKAETENTRMIHDVDVISHQLENWCIFLNKQEKPLIVEVLNIYKGYFLNEVMNCYRWISSNEMHWITSEKACSDRVAVYLECYERLANIMAKYSDALDRVSKMRVDANPKIEALEHGFIAMAYGLTACLCYRTVIYKRIGSEQRRGYIYTLQIYNKDMSRLIESCHKFKQLFDRNELQYDIVFEEKYYRQMLIAQNLQEFIKDA